MFDGISRHVNIEFTQTEHLNLQILDGSSSETRLHGKVQVHLCNMRLSFQRIAAEIFERHVVAQREFVAVDRENGVCKLRAFAGSRCRR